ncbi:Gfo/Idh/MocA family protein [Motilibacter aurantiacus]|uniref:Gfo/Idh/MocA family protein n=1 Tax=Motilibacter aurantiacus TaxID=2714955 RepID=UPI00140DBC6D|nr:Gfo/Idh/MocA family oxidoreductase [Motilibacter aurantiacus]NHC43844.1 Gfo/Idh/MocA family oxidoreductase [Motilibacter aurantiacus]
MAILRAGLIGLGMMGRHHARVLRSLEGVELVAVADPGGDPHSVAGELAVLRSAQELVAAQIDLAVVAVPTRFHEEVALTLAAGGVHTLVEKPLAPDVEGARRIVQAFEDAGLVGAVGHIERFNPALQSLRTRLEQGELGAIYQVATRRQGPFPNRIADVGVVKDLATHDIDLTAWVTGKAFRSVAARTAYKSGREHEDLVAAVGALEDGTVTNHLVNWLSPMKERVTTVTGENGTFVADTLTADLTFYSNGSVPTTWDAIAKFRGVSEGDVVRFAIPKPEPLMTEHTAFLQAVRAGSAEAAGIVTMRQGLATVAVAEAVIASAAKGETVDVVVP